MNRDEETDYERWYYTVQGLIEAVHRDFTLFASATMPLKQAGLLFLLEESVQDLASWHESYDINDGMLDWQREDIDPSAILEK